MVAMPDSPPLKKLRRLCETIDMPKYRKEIAGAHVRVFQKILNDPNTPNEIKIMVVGERMENFQHEGETLHQIEVKSQEVGWPTPGSNEETTRLQEISNHWIEIVLMKALIYDVDGGTTSSSSHLPIAMD